MAAEDGLKAQKLLAQGSALGNVGKNQGCIYSKTQGAALG